MIGYADLLEVGVLGELGERQREPVQGIRRAGAYLIELLDAMLNFATMEAGALHLSMGPVPVHEVVEEAERLVQRRFEQAGVALETVCAEGVRAYADGGRLQQVLLNILTNAAKFTPRGGRVAARCHDDGAWVRIDVEDSGPGIAAEEMERIFEPFEKGSATSPEGVGLGLAISRDLVQAMGGDVTVASEPGGGATFTVRLRAAAEGAEGSEPGDGSRLPETMPA